MGQALSAIFEVHVSACQYDVTDAYTKNFTKFLVTEQNMPYNRVCAYEALRLRLLEECPSGLRSWS